MTVFEAIKGRFSVRSYQTKPLSDSDLHTILEAGRHSQSAKNLQDWRFVIVRDESKRKMLAIAANGQQFVAEAPVVIVCCGVGTKYMMTCGQHSYYIDVAIAMENMALVAYELGLGTCWLGAFYEDQVKKLLKIPEDDVRVVGLLTVGYPARFHRIINTLVKGQAKKRKSQEDIIRYEKWS